ncbi:hypothetical protein [Hyphomicrobium sp. 1Nfss2.1]|uniref:hypothetical protein n=1 Tax=Hyphomicrobium sp. 1Nfss2.1 TaxID=3413936 RepID=UPI003C7A6D6A
MAQILSFRTPELRSNPPSSHHHERSAEVIVFPGVRYQHWGSDVAAVRDDQAAHRDVIELADQ